MPQALTGVQELAERLSVHSIEEIEIEQKAAPAELLALARLLAADSTSSFGAAEFDQKLCAIARVNGARRRGGRRWRRRPGQATRGTRAETVVVEPQDQLSKLLARLQDQANPAAAQRSLEHMAMLAGTATREGRTTRTSRRSSPRCSTGSRPSPIRTCGACSSRRCSASASRPSCGRSRRCSSRIPPPPRAPSASSSAWGRTASTWSSTSSRGRDGSTGAKIYREVLSRLTMARESLVQMLAIALVHRATGRGVSGRDGSRGGRASTRRTVEPPGRTRRGARPSAPSPAVKVRRAPQRRGTRRRRYLAGS